MHSFTTSKPYIKSGIGGAGNIHKMGGVMPIPFAPRIKVNRSSGLFSTGIGGAGNARVRGDCARLTREEIISRDIIRRDSSPQNYHTGIGGAGNCACSFSDDANSASLSSSASSDGLTRRLSGADKLKEKLGGSKSKGWHRPADSMSLSSQGSILKKA